MLCDVTIFLVQDRSVVHRLERICFCVENGEWPQFGRFTSRLNETDSRTTTPIAAALTPRSDYMVGASDASVVRTNQNTRNIPCSTGCLIF